MSVSYKEAMYPRGEGGNRPGLMESTFPFAFSPSSREFYFVALSREGGHVCPPPPSSPPPFPFPPGICGARLTNFSSKTAGEVFQVCNVKSNLAGYFPLSRDMTVFLEKYNEELRDGTLEITSEGVSLFRKTESDATTNGVRIQVRTAFTPTGSAIGSGVNDTKFFFGYKITMSMDPHGSALHSSKLSTRQWNIRMAGGRVEQVRGPGVIGLHPEMIPGATFSYASCTSDSGMPIVMDG